MRASCSVRPAAGLAILAALLALGPAPSRALDSATQAGISALDPAFRLPAGGLAMAGPVLDASSTPAAAWLLSEDLSLYALSEAGTLAARVSLADDSRSGRPGSFLRVDPFGRVVVAPGLAGGAGQVDGGDGVASRVALGVGVGEELLEQLDLEAGLLSGLADAGGLEHLAQVDEPAGQGPLAGERLQVPLDQQDLQVLFVQPEDHAVHR